MCRILTLTLQQLLWELSTFKQQLLAGKQCRQSKTPQALTNTTRRSHEPLQTSGKANRAWHHSESVQEWASEKKITVTLGFGCSAMLGWTKLIIHILRQKMNDDQDERWPCSLKASMDWIYIQNILCMWSNHPLRCIQSLDSTAHTLKNGIILGGRKKIC